MTKLDAPHTMFSIQENLQTAGFVHNPNGTNSQESNVEPMNSPVHPRQQLTEARNAGTDSTDEDSAAEKSTSLDDFLDAISSMPSHQHIRTAHAGRQNHSREEIRREKTSSGLSAIDPPKVGLRRVPLDYPLIRKYRQTGLEEEKRRVPFSRVNQVQSNLPKAVILDKTKQMGQESQPRAALAESRITKQREGRQKRQSIGSAGRGPRIYKHEVKMPPLLGPRLSDAARRAVVRDWTSRDEQEPMRKNEVEVSSEAPVLHRNHDSWEPQEEDRTRPESEAETELTAPKIRFVADEAKSPLPRNEPISTSQDVPAARGRALHGEVVRKLRVSEAPQVRVRKHMAVKSAVKTHLDAGSQQDKKMEPLGESGQLKDEPRRIKSRNWFREDLTTYMSPADTDLTMLHIRSHSSREAAPTGAREKARRLHREYHLPLLNQQPVDIPRP